MFRVCEAGGDGYVRQVDIWSGMSMYQPLQLAAMIGLVDKANNTPLHDAIRVHSIKNVQLLLNYGEDTVS